MRTGQTCFSRVSKLVADSAGKTRNSHAPYHTPRLAFRHPPPSSKEALLFISLRPPTLSAPSERFGCEYDCESNNASKHARKYDARPHGLKKKKGGGGGGGGSIKMIWVVSVMAKAMWTVAKETPGIIEAAFY